MFNLEVKPCFDRFNLTEYESLTEPEKEIYQLEVQLKKKGLDDHKCAAHDVVAKKFEGRHIRLQVYTSQGFVDLDEYV